MFEMINLHPSKEFRVPVTAECISPDVFQGKSCQEIEKLEIWEGNKQKRLRELFKIEDTRKEKHEKEVSITILGNAGKIRRIGAHMKNGAIIIHGNVGTHLATEMKGGTITVKGDAGGWAGSMMKGGMIEIHGNAGDYLGASYRGSDQGMSGGTMIVHGNAGNEAGAYMRNGLIKILGNVGQFAGSRMRKGTIFVGKTCRGRVGACMKNGKIIIAGSLESVLPTFTIDSIKNKVKIGDKDVVEGAFYRFLGDINENGEGKLYVSKEKNPQLAYYEKFL